MVPVYNSVMGSKLLPSPSKPGNKVSNTAKRYIMSSTFKAFGAKGFATGAAKKLFADGVVPADFVHMSDVKGTMKWGFLVDADGAAYIEPEVQAEPEVAAKAAPNMFAGIASTLGSTPAAPAPATTRTSASGYKIEKDRPQQNGIKQPSTGTTCRIIWDKLDALQAASGAVPLIGAFKVVAAGMGLDPTTTTIQYYRWRNYHGVSGRVAAPATPAAE